MNDFIKIRLQIIITTAQSSWLLECGSHKLVLRELYYLCSIPLVHFDFLVEEILAFHQNVIQFL
jgi:hypothetical protein